jgi:hypothetical protein
MAQSSKRLKKIIKRKSLQQRKTRKNTRFIKKGGNGELERATEQLLGNIEDIRNKIGDFYDLKPLPIPQPIPETELIKNLDGLTMLRKMAEFGKRQILYNLKQISKYTDDLILELLKYDPNSISTFLMENSKLFNRDTTLIQDYLPSSMWKLFGGVGNFFNWIFRKIIKTNTYVSEKPKLSKENLLHIFQQLSVKYPTINLNDNGIRDLILKDVLKKLYYIDNPVKPIEQLANVDKSYTQLRYFDLNQLKYIVSLCGILFFVVLHNLTFIIEYDANVGLQTELKSDYFDYFVQIKNIYDKLFQ